MSWISETESLLASWGEDGFYELHYYQSVDSTNEEIRRRAADGAGEGFTAVGEEQTAGRGRRGRSWKSPAGEALYFSVLLRPPLAPENLSMLTLVKGLSIAEAVRERTGLSAAIKWPNDLVIGGKKVSGTLTEAILWDGKVEGVVTGTGINVNNEFFPGEIAERATSLKTETGREISRGALLASVLRSFHTNYRTFLKSGDLHMLRDRYNALLAGKDGEVRIEAPEGAYTAVSRGIDTKGRLLAERETGGISMISAGEVSVRGLYGYV